MENPNNTGQHDVGDLQVDLKTNYGPYKYKINGMNVTFKREPTERDIDEAAEQLKQGAISQPEAPSFFEKMKSPLKRGLSTTVDQLEAGYNAPQGLSPGGKVVADTIGGFAETTTAGIPRTAIERITDRKLPRGNFAGQTAGIFNVGGGVRNALTRGGKAIPKTLGQRSALGAAEGAITGQFIAPQGKFTSPHERAVMGGVGALFGTAAEPALMFGAKVFRGLRKTGAGLKRPQDRARALQEGVDDWGKEQIKPLQAQIDESASKLTQDNAIIDDLVVNQSRRSAVETQRDLSGVFRQGRRNYQLHLDDMAKQFDEGRHAFTTLDLDRIAQDTLDEAAELFIDEGGGSSRVVKMIKDRLGIEESIMGVKSGVRPVPIQEVLKAKKAVDAAISSGVRGGTRGMSQDEIVSVIFNKKIGDAISRRVSGYRDLQSAYGKMAEKAKDAYRIFKIGKGSTQTKTASELIKRSAKGKAEGGELELLRRMEKRGTLEPGTKKPIVEPTRKLELERSRLVTQNANLERDVQSKINRIKNEAVRRGGHYKKQLEVIEALQRKRTGGKIVGGAIVGAASTAGTALYILDKIKVLERALGFDNGG